MRNMHKFEEITPYEFKEEQKRASIIYLSTGPLEFQDGQAFLMKTDILKETMYFSYDPNSFANLFALPAADVREIIIMNRNGEKPESLKTEPDVTAPEFVSAVGDDSITRFDEARKKKKKSRQGKGQKGNAAQKQDAAVKDGGRKDGGRDRRKENRPARQARQEQPKEK